MISSIRNIDPKWLNGPNFQFYLTDACQRSCLYCFRKEKKAIDHYFNLKINRNDISKLTSALNTIDFDCSFTLIGRRTDNDYKF